MGIGNSFFGKQKLQFLYEKLYHLALKGMNYSIDDTESNITVHTILQCRDRISSPSSVLFELGGKNGEFVKKILEAWQGMYYDLYVFEPSPQHFEVLHNSLPESPFLHLYNYQFSDSNNKINTTTLDAFCYQNKIPFIDFLKLNEDGNELKVLNGARELFEQNKIKIVLFQFGKANVESKTHFRDLYNFFVADFDLFRILTDGLRPLKQYSESCEIFHSAHYLAIIKNSYF